MVELEPGASRAAMAGIAHECALAAVALPDHALDSCGDVPGVAGHDCGLARPRLRSRRELALLELGNREIQQALEHLRQISRWHLMAKQLLHVAQLVVRVLTDRELQCILLGRQWLHRGTLLYWGRDQWNRRRVWFRELLA